MTLMSAQTPATSLKSRTRRRPQLNRKLWFVTALLLTVAGFRLPATPLAGQTTPSGNSGPENNRADNNRGRSERRAVDPLDLLRDQLDKQQARNDELREQLELTETQKQKLLALRNNYQTQIDSLSKEIPELRRWQDATFILGDARATDAVAIKTEGSQFSVVGKAGGQQIRHRVGAATKAKVPRVATEAGRRLARLVSNQVTDGTPLSMDLDREIRANVWKPHPIFPSPIPGRETQPAPQFIVFRQFKSPKQQIGIFQSVDPTSLTYFPVGQANRTVERDQVEYGSVRTDYGNDILDALDGDETYLNFCILSIADKLSTIGREPGPMAVGIHVALDGYDVGLNEEQRRTNNRIDLMGGVRLFGVSLAPWIGGGFHFDFSKPIPDPLAELKRMARSFEDKIYQRMIECGIPVVEGEHVKFLRAAQNADLRTDVGSQLNATHLVVAELDQTRSGLPRLSVRLIDVHSGLAIWTATSDSTCPKIEDSGNAIFLKSGILATISVDPKLPAEFKPELKGFEEPMKVALAHKMLANKLPKEQLVIIEPNRDDLTLAYRPMFDRQLQNLPRKNVVVKEFAQGFSEYLAKATTENNSNLSEQLVRAIVWELAAKGLTPAGRIETELQERSLYRLSIGKENGITSDSVIRVYRPKAAADDDQGPSDYPLPMALKIKSFNETTSEAFPIRTGLKGYWEEEGMWPRPGDIVFNPYEKRRKVAIFPPENRSNTLSLSDRKDASNNNSQRWNDIVQNAYEVSKKVQDKLRGGFLKLNSVAHEAEGDFGKNGMLDVEKTCRAAAEGGATHYIGGYITPKKGDKFEVTLQLGEITQNSENKWGKGAELITLPIGKLGLKNWD